MREFSFEEVEAATGGFAAKNLVGKGSHGNVYVARLVCGGDGGGGRVRKKKVVVVAVKRASHALGEAKLANEIAVLAAAGEVPGVVNLVGVAAGRRKGERMLVMEYMADGSLHDLLHRPTTTARPPPPWPRRVEIALDVAEAVRALHGGEPRVIHRDVKSANILWGATAAPASPTSASRSRPPPPRRRRRHRGGGGACAGGHDRVPGPVLHGARRLGPESDVFSFGVVLPSSSGPQGDGRERLAVVHRRLGRAAGRRRHGARGARRRLPAPRRAREERAVARVLAVAAAACRSPWNAGRRCPTWWPSSTPPSRAAAGRAAPPPRRRARPRRDAVQARRVGRVAPAREEEEGADEQDRVHGALRVRGERCTSTTHHPGSNPRLSNSNKNIFDIN